MGTPLPDHARVATDELAPALGSDAEAARAEAHHQGHRILVTLHLPTGVDAARSEMLAVRVTDAIRRFDRRARAVDVRVVTEPS